MKDLRELKELLIVLNSTDNFMGRYPIGNKELTLKVRELESSGVIKYDVHTKKWYKSSNKLTKRLIDESF